MTKEEIQILIDEAIKAERTRLANKLRDSLGYKAYNRKLEAYEFDWDKTVLELVRRIEKDD